jgi:hypothetical protein
VRWCCGAGGCFLFSAFSPPLRVEPPPPCAIRSLDRACAFVARSS